MVFERRVYDLTGRIPKGRVTTYKIIAEKLGTLAYRAVGNSLNKNTDKHIPCHRVINSDGFIGGYRKGLKEKLRILEEEGIKFDKRYKVTDFERFLFRFD